MLPLLQDIIRAFSKLPSFGPRLATRTIFYLLNQPARLASLRSALESLSRFERCPDCFFFKPTGGACSLCSDPSRAPSRLVLVEKETDVLTFEQDRITNSRYLILGELLEGASFSPEGEERLKKIESRRAEVEELILALPPTALGDATARFLAARFENKFKKITRLARGLPSGAEVEFADQETLRQAFNDRK